MAKNLIDIDDGQIIYGKCFAHVAEPTITIARNAFWVNTGCIRRLPNISYIHFILLIHERRLILKPCDDETQHGVRWKTPSGKPRKMLSNDFFNELATLLDWDSGNRYRLLGKIARGIDWTGFAFDLTQAEIFPLSGVTADMNNEEQKPQTWSDFFINPLVTRFSEDTIINI